MKKFLFSIFFFFISLTFLFAQAPCESLVHAADRYAARVAAEWKIPGLSFSIVKDGRLLLSTGYGVKEKGDTARVDGNSIYHIGSISKSFTAAVMASLVDEGLLSWEDRVKKILPEFDLYDDYIENHLLVKDLMTHKTGIRGQAGTYIPNLGYDREDVLKMLKYIRPANGFRDTYAYNNITFLIASAVIEKVSGKSWEENLQTRILDPLGMKSTYINAKGYLNAGENTTVAHDFRYVKDSMYVAPVHGEERALNWMTVIGPAGGISSNAADMSRWVQFHLDNGRAGGRQVISAGQMDFLHKGQTIVSQGPDYLRLYAHCWFKEQNDRYRVFFHTGTTWGYTAICAFVPDLNLGLVVLCNSEVPSSPRYAIMRRTIDLFMGDIEPSKMKDWSRDYLAAWWPKQRASWQKEEKRQAGKKVLPAPGPEALAGEYHKAAPFMDAAVSMENGGLYITIGRHQWKHRLNHVSGNEYEFRSDGHAFPVVFHLNAEKNRSTSFEVDFNYDEGFGPWVRKQD